MRDYLTTVGVLDDVRPDGKSPLRLACETSRIVQVVHFLRKTALDPFENVDGESLLMVLSESAQEFQATSTFVWFMCRRYASDPRWRKMISSFLVALDQGTTTLSWAQSVPRPGTIPSLDHKRTAMECYAKLFFVIQRSGMEDTGALVPMSSRDIHASSNRTFAEAASTDFTVERTKQGHSVSYDQAHQLILDQYPQ